MLHISTPLHALTYSVPSSASAAEDMTALIISETVRMAPLFGGKGWLSDR